MQNSEDVLFKKRRLLHEAARNGNIFQLRYLLEKRGESINTRDSNRQTALMIAAYTKYASKQIEKNILKLVLRANPDLNAVDKSGRTALIHACKANNSQAVRLLVSENTLDLWIDAQDCDGMTSLMYAVRNNNFKMVVMLLSPWRQFGLSLILENKYGENVMDIALAETGAQICGLLTEHGFYAQNNMSLAHHHGGRAKTTPCNVTAERRQGMTAVRRVKPCLVSLNINHGKKKNRVSQDDTSSTTSSKKSTSTSSTSTSSATTRQQQQLHHIFQLYAQQLTPSYKKSAAPPFCLDDRDDAESLDSLSSIQSFRSVGFRARCHDDITDLFNIPNATILPGRRSRRSGAGLVVPAVGRSRKISAPCFPSNPMFKTNLPRQGEMRRNFIH